MPGIFDKFKKRDGVHMQSDDSPEVTIRQAEKRMNRFKILVVLVGLLIFAEGSGLIYFATKYQEMITFSNASKLSGDTKDAKAVLDVKTDTSEYRQLLSKYEAIKLDRDNLIVQTKRIFSEKRESQELIEKVESLEKSNRELSIARDKAVNASNDLEKRLEAIKVAQKGLDSFEGKRKDESGKTETVTPEIVKSADKKTVKPVDKYNDKIANLQKALVALKKENRSLQSDNHKNMAEMSRKVSKLNSQCSSVTKELERVRSEKEKTNKFSAERIKELEGRNNEIRSDFAEAKREIAKFKRLEREINSIRASKEDVERKRDGLKADLATLKNKYEDALVKNRGLANELEDLPRRFSELSKQNTRLTKETSEMHYNLGVFYSKNKEFKRALAEFEKATELNPEDAQAHFNLGYIYAECVVDRDKAIEHFRYFLNLAKSDDQDLDWAKKYLLTWETFNGDAKIR